MLFRLYREAWSDLVEGAIQYPASLDAKGAERARLLGLALQEIGKPIIGGHIEGYVFSTAINGKVRHIEVRLLPEGATAAEEPKILG